MLSSPITIYQYKHVGIIAHNLIFLQIIGYSNSIIYTIAIM